MFLSKLLKLIKKWISRVIMKLALNLDSSPEPMLTWMRCSQDLALVKSRVSKDQFGRRSQQQRPKAYKKIDFLKKKNIFFNFSYF